MLRDAACVDESDHHALMYVWLGQTQAVREVRQAREDRDWRAGGATMLQPLMLTRKVSRSQTHFALQAIVEHREAVAKRIAVLLCCHSEVGEVRRGLPVTLSSLTVCPCHTYISAWWSDSSTQAAARSTP